MPIVKRDHALLQQLRTGDSTALEALQQHYTKTLSHYIYSHIEESETTRDIIQEIFLSMWSKRETLIIESSLRQYLFGAAKHKVLDYRRFIEVRKYHARNLRRFLYGHNDHTIENWIQADHIMHVVESTLSTHAQRAQDVFRLSRFGHLSNQDIATRMNISRRTVENYISTVLTSLRPLLIPVTNK